MTEDLRHSVRIVDGHCNRCETDFDHTLTFHYHDWRAFTYTPWASFNSKWQFLFVFYRWFTMASFMPFYYHTIHTADTMYSYFSTITSWYLTAHAIYLVWSSIIIAYTYLRYNVFKFSPTLTPFRSDMMPVDQEGSVVDTTSFHHKLQWALNTLSTDLSIASLIIVLADHDSHFVEIIVYMSCVVLSFMDMLITGIPRRPVQIVFSSSFTALFAVYKIFYQVQKLSEIPLDDPLDKYTVHELDKLFYQTARNAIVGIAIPMVLVPLANSIMFDVFRARKNMLKFFRSANRKDESRRKQELNGDQPTPAADRKRRNEGEESATETIAFKDDKETPIEVKSPSKRSKTMEVTPSPPKKETKESVLKEKDIPIEPEATITARQPLEVPAEPLQESEVPTDEPKEIAADETKPDVQQLIQELEAPAEEPEEAYKPVPVKTKGESSPVSTTGIKLNRQMK